MDVFEMSEKLVTKPDSKKVLTSAFAARGGPDHPPSLLSSLPDVSSLAGNVDIHAFSSCFKTRYDFILHMYQSVCSHIIPKRMVSARDGGKGIVKGLFDVDRRIPVRGLFFDIQTFRVHAFRQDRSMLRCIHAS